MADGELIDTGQDRRWLFVVGSLGIGGAEQFLLGLVERLAQSGARVTVLSLLPGGALEPEFRSLGVELHSLPRLRLGSLPQAAARLWTVLRRSRPDIVVGWMYHGALVASALKLLRPRAVLLWSVHHTLDRWDEEKKATRGVIRALRFLRRAPRRIVFCSQRSAETHFARGFPVGRSCVIHNGFDGARFVPAPAARGGRRRVGHVARLHPMKDHANFLAAAGALAAGRDDVEFVMAGSGVDEQNATLRDLVERHGLGGRVRLLGPRRDLPQLMASLDLLVVSSAWGEAFPIVIGEAMSCGVPCVSTDVGDARALIGDTGLVVPPRDPQAMADALSSLLDEDEEQFGARRRSCRARILEGFSLQQAADAFAAAAGAAEAAAPRDAPESPPRTEPVLKGAGGC